MDFYNLHHIINNLNKNYMNGTIHEEKKTGPKDVFGHLLAIIALYGSVISFGSLIFGYINIYFPDLLSYQYEFSRASLRWPLSVFVILFPLYVFLSVYLQRDIVKNPEKRDLRIRSWLLYFTLFLATIVIAGDFVSLIFKFLGGELTIRFVLKMLTVLMIAVAVFVYYVWNLRKNIPALQHPKMKFFVYGIISIAIASVLAGFFAVGSPKEERMRRFDDRRTGDLSMIQSEVIAYWQAKSTLPLSLEDLRDEIRGFTSPVDPESGEQYEYQVIDEYSFNLCATFKTVNKDQGRNTVKSMMPMMPFNYQESWLHDAGHVCFQRTIDPDRFPPSKGGPEKAVY